jgi:guanylate kinase
MHKLVSDKLGCLYVISTTDKIKENTNTIKEGLNGDYFWNSKYFTIQNIGDVTPYDFKILASSNNNLRNIVPTIINVNDCIEMLNIGIEEVKLHVSSCGSLATVLYIDANINYSDLSTGLKVIIIGHGASGKDTLKQRFIERGGSLEVSYTTRPIRKGEKEGIDYHYVTKDKFVSMINNNEFIQFDRFGTGNYYGTHKSEWKSKGIFIMTPIGVINLLSKYPELRKNIFIIFINIPEEIRRQRLIKRNDPNDTIERRLESDRIQFKSVFEGKFDVDLTISDPNF